MSEPAIQIGDKLHIITRRLFEGDVRRHFAGEVIGISGEIQAIYGYAFIFNGGSNTYEKRPELRTRITSLGDSGYVVNRIPYDVNIDSLVYAVVDGRLVVTDRLRFALDINEFGITA